MLHFLWVEFLYKYKVGRDFSLPFVILKGYHTKCNAKNTIRRNKAQIHIHFAFAKAKY